MSDLATMSERIQEELPRNSAVEENRVYRAIIDSVKFYGYYALGFNEETSTFSTVVSQQAYTRGSGASNFPADLFYPKEIYVDVTGTWEPLDQRPLGVVRYQTPTDLNRGYPRYWAWHKDSFYFTPIPHVASDIRIDYIKDIGTPTITFDGSQWTFDDEDGNALTGAYTNEWFTDAEELIRLHAEVQLTEVVFKNREHSSFLRQREREVLHNLQFKQALTKNNMNRQGVL